MSFGTVRWVRFPPPVNRTAIIMWFWCFEYRPAYITSHSRGDFASRDLLYPLSTFLSASGLHTAVVRQSLDDHALVYVPRAPSFELSDELDNADFKTCLAARFVGSRHCTAVFSLQVPKSCTDLDPTLLYTSTLGTCRKFVRKNKMLALGVCLPQPCLSAGRRFAASRSHWNCC